ncbi:MAG: alpha-amylase family glycosyl hydrolase [Janthinobacterium lividum]
MSIPTLTPSKSKQAQPAASPATTKTAPAVSTKAAPAKPVVATPERAGFGALPHATGTTFRVWAPAASAVSVVGTFNDWDKTASPLQAEGDGNWAADLPGVKAGDGYKFALTTPAGELTRNDPYARAVTNSAGHSLVFDPYDFDWEGDNFQMPAWNDLIIYELHIGTFNAKEAGHPGTFRDVIERLGYLQSLGINCIEIMPATEFPGAYSWGYNPSNPFALESDYGGAEAFRELVKAAHQHGIAVILDVVYNHFGPGDLDLWQFDGWQEDNGGGIYFYNDWRAETPWGHNRPDYGRPEVRRYIRDNALMWLEDYHCDGLRMDAIAFIRNVKGEEDPGADLPDGWSLMRWVNEEIRASQPWKITIAEDLRGNPAITAPLEGGGEGFSAQWSSSFIYPMHQALTAFADVDRDMHAVSRAICTAYNGNAFQRVIYTESHDEVANGKSRLPEEIAPGNVENYFAKKRMVLGASLVLTAPGIPMLFQGQEFLAPGSFNDTEPLEWAWAEAHTGLTQLYRDLIALRRDLRGVTPGLRGQGCHVFHVNNDAKVIAFARWDGRPEDATIVVANFGNQAHEDYTIGLPDTGEWTVRFNSDWAGYDADFQNFPCFGAHAESGEYDGYPQHGNVALGPYAVVVLSRS